MATNGKHCLTGEVETEMHFLLTCETFNEITNIYFCQFNSVISHFKDLSYLSKLKIPIQEKETGHIFLPNMYEHATA